jgi:hypothetical protein
MKSNRNIGMILVAVFLIIYGLMGFGVYFGPAILLLNLIALTAGVFIIICKEYTAKGMEQTAKRIIGRLCQSPFESGRLTRLCTQLRRGRQRRRINFPRRRSRIGESPCRHQRCRAAAAGSTRFNATHRSEVTDQCFVTVISNAQRLLPTKYTSHTRRMIISCDSWAEKR